MGTTPSGLYYPDATDTPDIPADLQTSMESVDDLINSGSWVTATTGFTAASNWTLGSVRYRILLGLLVDLFVTATRATSAITVAAGDGDIANVDVYSAVPSAIVPAQQAYGQPGQGRLYGAVVTTGGVIRLTAVNAGGVNVAIGDVFSARFLYPLT